MKLPFYRLNDTVPFPKFATKGSACFDLSAFIPGKEDVKIYSGKQIVNVPPLFDDNNKKYYVNLMPGERAMIRTGLVFDIPEGHSIRIHPRSGMVLKYGITLANCEGVIDEDYTLETRLIMYNMNSMDSIKIYDGDRIAQAEVVRYEQPELIEIYEQPGQKTDRVGGFGSTGKN